MTKENIRKLLLAIIFVLILIVIALFIGRFTYSYIAPPPVDELVGDGEVTPSGDTIIFSKGNDISLNATTDNFYTGAGNLSGTTSPQVRLIASSDTGTANSTYFAGIRIYENTYQYSTTNQIAELILSVYDENGSLLQASSDTLPYVTVGGISGFDITGRTGAYNIAIDHPISTTSSTNGTTHTWTFTLTFVNLDTDQAINETANLEMEVVLQKDAINMPSLADVCSSGENLATCIQTLYNTYGEGYDGLYLHDGIGSYVNSDQEAGDNSYRYSGANPNNYVCFGDDCSDINNLYRIIGVFDDQVKLIMADYPTTDLLGTDGAYNNTYYDKYVSEWWTSYYKGSQDLSSIGTYDYDWRNNSNVWSELNLNTTNLNVNYLNNVADTYKNMIYTSTWYVGGTDTGSTGLNYLTVHDWFNAESTGTTWTGKIGLMYISDYGYAASPIYWNLVSLVGGYAPATDNWMYMGLHEWTITRNSNSSRITLFGIHEQGGANDLAAYAGNSVAVRPAFYLKSQVLYAGGDGSKENPIQLS